MPELIDTLLVVTALSGSAWLALGLGLSQLFRRHPARAHAILVTAAIGTLLTPFLYAAVRQINAGILPAPTFVARDFAGAVAVSDNTGNVPSDLPALPREIIANISPNRPQEISQEGGDALLPSMQPSFLSPTDLAHAASPTDTKSPGAAWVAPFSRLLSLLYVLLGTWLLLSLTMLARLLRDFAAGMWLLRNSRRSDDQQANESVRALARHVAMARAPRLATSDHISSPVLWAWSFPPCILIPRHCEKSVTSEAIYLHELAHLVRRDHLSALAAELVLCLLPWHPLGWWMRSAMDARAEEACYDWTVTSGCDPAEYAQALVNLAPTSASALRLAAMSKHSSLKGRIQRLLGSRPPLPFLGPGWTLGLGGLCFFMTGMCALIQPRIVLAQYSAQAPEPVAGEVPEPPEKVGDDAKASEFEVLVLSEGKPAEGATVWMEELTNQRLENRVIKKVGPVAVPKSGKVRFTVSAGAFHCQFLAKNEQGHLGAGSCLWFVKKTLVGENRITLELEKTGSIQGQLFFENQPLADAQCQLVEWHGPPKTGTHFPPFIFSPQAHVFAPIGHLPISVKTDRNGRFSLDGIPENCDAEIQITKEGMGAGTLRIPWKLDEAGKRQPVEAALDLGGSLEIAIEGENRPIGNQGIWMSPIEVERTRDGRPLVRMAPGRPLNDPEFAIPGMAGHASGTYRLSIPLGLKEDFHFGPPQVVKIEPGKVSKVTLRKIPLAVCSGRIIDAKTGKGIPKMMVRLKGTEKWHGEQLTFKGQKFTETETGFTDNEGHYSIACRGNHTYTLAFGDRSEIYTDNVSPHWDPIRKWWIPVIPHISVADGEMARFPDVSFVPSRTVTGTVRDDSGKPVDGPYQVFCLTGVTTEKEAAQIEKGQFTLAHLNPAIPLKFFIRQGKAVNLVSAVPTDRLDKTVDFTISEKNAVSCRGKVVDAQGRPIAKASVTLIWLPDYLAYLRRRENLDYQLSQIVEVVETDEQGRFAISGLWDQESYRLRVQAKGFKTSDPDSGIFSGPLTRADEAIDLSDYRLERAR